MIGRTASSRTRRAWTQKTRPCSGVRGWGYHRRRRGGQIASGARLGHRRRCRRRDIARLSWRSRSLVSLWIIVCGQGDGPMVSGALVEKQNKRPQVPGGQGFARRLANLFSPLEGRPYSARGSISTGLSRDRWPEEGTLPAFLCIGGGVVCLCLGVTLNRVFGAGRCWNSGGISLLSQCGVLARINQASCRPIPLAPGLSWRRQHSRLRMTFGEVDC